MRLISRLDLAYLGAAIAAITGMWYIIRWYRDPAVTPRPRTWGILAIIGVEAVYLEWQAGGGMAVLVLGVIATTQIIVFGLSWVRPTAEEPLHWISLMIALVGLVLYGLFHESHPAIGIVALTIADGIAMWQTIVGAYQYPDTEPFGPWAVVSFASLLTVLAVEHLSVASLTYPVYLVIACGAVAAASWHGTSNPQGAVPD